MEMDDVLVEKIRSIKVTLTNRVLYFPCLSSRPQKEDLPYLIYPNSDWLVFPVEPPYINERFMEGLLKLLMPEKITDSLIYAEKYKDDIETRLLELMYKYDYRGGNR